MPYLEINRNGVACWDHVTQQVNGIGQFEFISSIASAVSSLAPVVKQIAQTVKPRPIPTAAPVSVPVAAPATAAVAARPATIFGGDQTLMYVGIGAMTLIAIALATR
jgi:hypothetical protein